MDGDDGVRVDDGIHKGKGQCNLFLLGQRICDGSARVAVDQSARRGTYHDGVGVGVGVGIVEAEGLLL